MSDIYQIKIEDILKIKKHNYFPNNSTDTNIMHNSIRDLMIQAMKNNSKEALLVMRRDNIRDYTIYTSDMYNKIRVPNVVHELGSQNKVKFIMIHNHPNNTVFSMTDIKTLISYLYIDCIGVITNNCKYIAFAKVVNNPEYSRTEMMNYINCKQKYMRDIDIINELSKHGLQVGAFRNY